MAPQVNAEGAEQVSALVVLVGERQVERARRAPGDRVGAHAQHEPPQRQALAHVNEQHAAVVRQGAEQVALREHRDMIEKPKDVRGG